MKYIAMPIRSGDYQNAGEVVLNALCLHRCYRSMVIEALRSEIEKGWDGAANTHSVQNIIQTKKKRRPG